MMIAPAKINLGQSAKKVFNGINNKAAKQNDVIVLEQTIVHFLPTLCTIRMQKNVPGIATKPPRATLRNKFFPSWPTNCMNA